MKTNNFNRILKKIEKKKKGGTLPEAITFTFDVTEPKPSVLNVVYGKPAVMPDTIYHKEDKSPDNDNNYDIIFPISGKIVTTRDIEIIAIDRARNGNRKMRP